MQGITDLHIANNLEDLKRIAYPEKFGRNPKALERVIKNLYQEIFRETSDQEKCYIHCLRYLLSIERLCKIGDAKYIKIIYAHEISRVTNRLEELRPILEDRYRLEHLRQQKKKIISSTKKIIDTAKPEPDSNKQLFTSEFVSVKEVFQAIQNNANILIVDIRPTNEYSESKIKYENIINISDDIIVAGLSANVLGNKLKDETQSIWDKRDSFDALVFLDWNSGSDNITCTKLKYLKDSVVEWDCLRDYKQDPVIINGGFKEFLDSYPGSVTNVHVNFIRTNEDIDELLELESISYPEPDQNISIMPLKQFTIEELEESTKIEDHSDEDIETDTTNQNNEVSSTTTSTEDIHESDEVLAPKGGGASIDKPVGFSKDQPVADIKNKIEEQRLKLLLEARNKKNKAIVHNDKKRYFIEDQMGDKPEYSIKKVPPPIRRETKPKKVCIFIFLESLLLKIKFN